MAVPEPSIYIYSGRINEIVYVFSQCFRFVFKVYGHPADDNVRGDTSGSFQTLCLVQFGNTGDYCVQTDERMIEEDARRLWRVNIQLRIVRTSPRVSDQV